MLMEFEFLVFLVVVVIVAIVWFSSACHSGVVKTVSTEGFVLRNLLKFSIEIRWADISSPARMFERFLPRIVVCVKGRKHRWLKKSYTVFLRGRRMERDFFDRLESTTGVESERFKGRN